MSFLGSEALGAAPHSFSALSYRPVVVCYGANIGAIFYAFALKLMGKEDATVFDGSLTK